jgi:hypothetical protein
MRQEDFEIIKRETNRTDWPTPPGPPTKTVIYDKPSQMALGYHEWVSGNVSMGELIPTSTYKIMMEKNIKKNLKFEECIDKIRLIQIVASIIGFISALLVLLSCFL